MNEQVAKPLETMFKAIFIQIENGSYINAHKSLIETKKLIDIIYSKNNNDLNQTKEVLLTHKLIELEK